MVSLEDRNMSKSKELAKLLKSTLWNFIENEKLSEAETLDGILLITAPTIAVTENPEETLKIYINCLKNSVEILQDKNLKERNKNE